MDDQLPRQAIRKVDARRSFPLIALEAIVELRRALDQAEAESMVRARELGASVEDLALALGITRQGAHYRLKQLGRASAPVRAEVEDVPVASPGADAPTPTDDA